MSEEIDESPYCEVCGTCGCIGCCGIRNFIAEHIEGKTNCKNESWVIQDLINLCDYKDEVFKQNKKYKEVLDKIKKWVLYQQQSNENLEPYISTDKLDEILELLEKIE